MATNSYGNGNALKNILVLLIILLTAGCQVRNNTTTPSGARLATPAPETNQVVADALAVSADVEWNATGDGWMVFGTPPDCQGLFQFQLPVDLNSATSILYPGQSRPDYKPHGGFRFDNAPDNRVAFVSPVDGKVMRGARYLVNGELQYTFDIVHPCGMMARVGHLLELTPKFQAIAETFPAAIEGDSRTTRVAPSVAVTQGEPIATQIGVTQPTKNVFVDVGLFDLRQKNTSSQDSAWAAMHDPELEQHGVCWFDYLPPAEAAVIRALPGADATAGTTSDYCTP